MHPQEFIKLAVTAPSADNSQPWQFEELPDEITCYYKNRASTIDPFGSLGHGTLLSAGALLENINTIRPQNSSKPELVVNSSGWKISISPSNWPDLPEKSAIDLLQGRHTNRHPYSALPVKLHLANACYASSRSILLTASDAIKSAAQALNECSIARFNNRELHEWLFSSLRWAQSDVDSGTGLDINTLHLPPGGRLFMQWIAPWDRMKLLNRFGICHLLAAADSALFRCAPGIVAFIGGKSAEDILECGQLMERVWMILNSQGVAVHPYYVLTDMTNRMQQKKLSDEWAERVRKAQGIVSEIFQLLPDEQLHMLFRIGVPSKTPIRSQRLSPSRFLTQGM